MDVLLNQGVRPRQSADGAVEIHECGVAVCFGVVKDTLNACLVSRISR